MQVTTNPSKPRIYGNNLSDEAQRDIAFWKKSGNVIIQKKIMQLLESIEEAPFIGKPEPLKHNLSGLWSRRINQNTE